jgi:hypothetical protein
MGAYFTGRPRVRWWPWSWVGALVAGTLSFLVLMEVGHTLVTADRYAVRCDDRRVSTPRASALASATPVFREWGLRRYAIYRDHECALASTLVLPDDE